MITLNDTAIQLIRDNKQLKKAIINELDCTERALFYNLAKNSVSLTEVRVLNLVVEHSGKGLSELITGGKVNKLITE